MNIFKIINIPDAETVDSLDILKLHLIDRNKVIKSNVIFTTQELQEEHDKIFTDILSYLDRLRYLNNSSLIEIVSFSESMAVNMIEEEVIRINARLNDYSFYSAYRIFKILSTFEVSGPLDEAEIKELTKLKELFKKYPAKFEEIDKRVTSTSFMGIKDGEVMHIDNEERPLFN